MEIDPVLLVRCSTSRPARRPRHRGPLRVEIGFTDGAAHMFGPAE